MTAWWKVCCWILGSGRIRLLMRLVGGCSMRATSIRVLIRRLVRRANGFLMTVILRLGGWIGSRCRLRGGFVNRGSIGPRRVGLRVILVRLVICGRAWWIGGSVTTFRRRVFLLAAG